MIGIIDYDMGNIQSVLNAFEYLQKKAFIARTPGELEQAGRIVLPGVGAFSAGMKNIRGLSLDKSLHEEVIVKKKPFLGICLGMQLICRESFEFGHHEGLGWIDASVCRFEKELGVRVPHVGWNDLKIVRKSPLFESAEERPDVYFVHSYYVNTKNKEDVIATANYGREFAAVIGRENIFAAQFHPEKSQKAGLGILERFSEIC